MTKADLEFLSEILDFIANGNEREKIYALLCQNLDKITLRLIEALQVWAESNLLNIEPEQQKAISYVFGNFSLYLMEFPLGKRADNIEIALAGNEIFLTICDFPVEWAKAQYNRGSAYSKRIKGDKFENIELAISAFQNALLVFTQQDFPVEWAGTKNNLGAVYTDRIKENRSENIEKAIEFHRKANSVFTQENFLIDWARTQVNLSNAYKNRIKGDRSENIERAIEYNQNALSVFSRQNFPINWATIQQNQTAVYKNRIKGDRSENIELAIEFGQNALSVFTQENFPIDLARTKINLGNSYKIRIKGDKAENIELAISAFRNALLIFTQQKSIYERAYYQNNLGDAYRDRIKGDKAENIENAISVFQNALLIFTQQDFPIEWSGTQNNLGTVYQDRIKGEKSENIENAIAAYRKALTIRTPQSDPIGCLQTNKNLGFLYFREGDWQLAVDAHTSSIEVVEKIRLTSITDDRRQEIMDESISVYENIVQAYVNLGQYERAIEYAERSRCRRLVDLMASNDLYGDGNIPPQIAEYLEAYYKLQQDIEAERKSFKNDDSQARLVGSSATRSNRAIFEAAGEAIARLETEKQQVWQQIRSCDKVLSEQIQVEPIDFDTIRQLIPDDKTALVYCYTTITSLQIFVVFKNKPVQLHTTNLDHQQLADFGINTWFNPYLYSQGKLDEEEIEQFIKDKNPQAWRKKMPHALAQLAKDFKLSTLIQKCLQNIEELIIVPHLYLHSIPFCALPIGSPAHKFLGERFRLRILPSVQVLQFCHQREDIAWKDRENKFGTVEDADNSLPFSQYEGKQIAQMYGISDENRLRGQKATVDNYRQLVKEKEIQILHSSHHASSRLDNPLESQLFLAEGTISLGEIMSPGWRVPHLTDVFLSCCETNLSISRLSDEPLTLATGFLCAGARSVVSTLWSVDDLATAIFSIVYYRLRKDDDDLDRPTTLQKAQHQLKHLSGEEIKQNYYTDLDEYLTTQREQAKTNRKKATKQLKQLVIGTPEYHQVAADKSDWNQAEKKLSESIKRLKQIIKESQPFSHPYYWAGFVSQGLR